MYKILDLFAGAGGLSLGFEKTGLFEVAAIVENNKNAANTYINNHPGLKNYEDILTVDFDAIKKECPNIDVVIGGPPCQGFSNANRQRRKLINGSNELVKRYVKAIEEINPTVFVMENVKTIASDKHSFCVTKRDKKHIKDTLKLHIHDKEVILYEGDLFNEVHQLTQEYNNNIKDLMLLDEDDLYFLYNMCKKHNQIKKLLSKNTNEKALKKILDKLIEKENLPDWYNKITIDAKNYISQLLAKDENIVGWPDRVKIFWDVHRFFAGINELNDQEAVFSYSVINRSIKVEMKTYIVIDYIRASFDYLGYSFNEQVLNAANFGVPQTRERFVMIGVKKDFTNVKPEFPNPIIENPKDFITVRKALVDLEDIQPTTGTMSEVKKRKYAPKINSYYRKLVMCEQYKEIHNHVCTDTRPEALARFKMIEPGKNFHSLPDELKSSYENPSRTQNTVYRRLDPNLPSDTVVNVRKSMWIHHIENRAISAREAARLQSFPDDYIFYGTKDSVYQQIGNAVPPVLGRAVAESVLDILGNTEPYEKLKELFNKN